MIKLFASDLDGTLLNVQHEVDDTIEKGVNSVIEKGLFFSVATGRGLSMVNLNGMNDKAFYICLNGALVASPERKPLKYELIDKKILKDLIENFKDLNLEFFSPYKIYTHLSKEEIIESRKVKDSDNKGWVKRFMSDVLNNFEVSQSDDEILNADICKVNCHIDADKDYQKLDDFLEKYKESVINAPCDDGLYEITKTGVDKGSAIHWLAEHLNVLDEEVAVYGDGGNDLAMLKRFENSYCPSTGMEIAKQAANNIIGPYDEYSVVEHMLQTIQNQ